MASFLKEQLYFHNYLYVSLFTNASLNMTSGKAKKSIMHRHYNKTYTFVYNIIMSTQKSICGPKIGKMAHAFILIQC